MNRNRILFIVENTTDKVIVETLASHVLPATVQFHTVRLGHKSRFTFAYTSALKFLAHSYHHVIVIFDTDSTDELEIENKYSRYSAQFVKYGISRDVSLCPAVPQIEAWLLGHYLEHPECEPEPKAKLAELMPDGVDNLRQLAETADLELMKKRSPSFAQFVQTLERVVALPVQPPLVYTVGMPIPA